MWLRHELETFKRRLKALYEHVGTTGALLIESQLKAMEKARRKKQPGEKIEIEHVGYLGSQDTFYVGDPQGRRPDLSADLH